MFPRRQDEDQEEFNCDAMNEDVPLDDTNDLNSSLANVLSAFSNTPTSNNDSRRGSLGLKTEREVSKGISLSPKHLLIH